MLKRALRKEIGTKLSNMTPELVRNHSLNTTDAISALPLFKNSKSIGVYMHMDKEMETNHLINKAFDFNKTVYLPRIENLDTFNDYQRFPKQRQCLHFLSVKSKNEIESLQPRGKYGIREPDYSENRANDLLFTGNKLDVLFLPAVGYTKTGNRLGHGAGFYDDFIKRYRKQYGETPILVGVGLPEQLVEDDTLIQMEEHDEPLDYIVVGESVFNCKDYVKK